MKTISKNARLKIIAGGIQVGKYSTTKTWPFLKKRPTVRGNTISGPTELGPIADERTRTPTPTRPPIPDFTAGRAPGYSSTAGQNEISFGSAAGTSAAAASRAATRPTTAGLSPNIGDGFDHAGTTNR
jgi:hypothetical protein